MTKMVFIVGASRSGTTMMNRVLGNHSQILALNELHYFGDLWAPGPKITPLNDTELRTMAARLLARHTHGIWQGAPSEMETRQASEIVAQLDDGQKNGRDLFCAVIDRIASEHDKSIISEQTPRNIFYAHLLLEYYPDAYVIQLVRDPRAVLASQKGRWRRKWLGGKNTPWAETIRVWANYHPITMCKLWRKSVQAGLPLASHPRFMGLRFEDLVSSPQSYIEKICGFLGIEYQPGMENVPQIGSSSRNNIENRRGISADVLQAWKNNLTTGEIAFCEKITADMMSKYEYQPVTSRIPLFSTAYILLLFPLHLLGVIITNPKRALIQLRAYFNKSNS